MVRPEPLWMQQQEESTMEQVQYVNNWDNGYKGHYQKNQLLNHYHAGLRHHENLFYGNTNNVIQPPGFTT